MSWSLYVVLTFSQSRCFVLVFIAMALLGCNSPTVSHQVTAEVEQLNSFLYFMEFASHQHSLRNPVLRPPAPNSSCLIPSPGL